MENRTQMQANEDSTVMRSDLMHSHEGLDHAIVTAPPVKDMPRSRAVIKRGVMVGGRMYDALIVEPQPSLPELPKTELPPVVSAHAVPDLPASETPRAEPSKSVLLKRIEDAKMRRLVAASPEARIRENQRASISLMHHLEHSPNALVTRYLVDGKPVIYNWASQALLIISQVSGVRVTSWPELSDSTSQTTTKLLDYLKVAIPQMKVATGKNSLLVTIWMVQHQLNKTVRDTLLRRWGMK